MSRFTRVMLFVFGFMALVPSAGARAGVDHRRGPGPFRRGAARRHGGGVEPRPDREGPLGRHRRQRPVPHHRSAARHLRRDAHAERLLDGEARRHRVDRHLRRHDRRRPARRRARGDDHRHGREPDRRRAAHDAAARVRPAGDRGDSGRPQPHQHGGAHPRPGGAQPGRGALADVGGTNNLQNTTFTIHGGRTSDTRLQLDGVRLGNVLSGGEFSNFVPDTGATQEVAVDYAAVSAEQPFGGLRIDIIPREGGNTVQGRRCSRPASTPRGRPAT